MAGPTLNDVILALLQRALQFSPEVGVVIEQRLGHPGHAATIGSDLANIINTEMGLSTPLASAIIDLVAALDARYGGGGT